MNANRILAIIAALAAQLGWLYLHPFGRCPKCKGTGHIKPGRRVKAPAPSTGSPARSATVGGPPPGTPRRTVGGIPDGAHTHGSGKGGAGTALLVVLAAALIAAIARPPPRRPSCSTSC